MSAKQDRQGARTPADLERRYNFGQSFAEVMGLANDARKSAEEALAAAENAGKPMTSEEVFNLLTNNGANQGLYRGEDGELYINATYIKSGKISSELIDGSTLNITSGATIAGWEIDNNSIFKKKAGGTWGSGTFMCTGSNSPYKIGGSGSITGWVFGAGGRFGVTSDGDVYCSALYASDGCKIGEWYIQDGFLCSGDPSADDLKNVVWIEPNRVVYIYNQDSGEGIIASWEQIVEAGKDFSDLEFRVTALEELLSNM